MWNRLIEKDIQAYQPVVQVLAKATKSIVSAEQPVGLDFTNQFEWINRCIENPNRYQQFRNELDKGICYTVDALLDMKKQGIVSKDFRISNYKAFKESALVKKFSYKKRTLDLTDHLMSQKDMMGLKQEVSLSL